MPVELVNDVNWAIDADKDRFIEIFKDIHQNPELGFTEVRTSEIVAKELKALGYEVKTGIGKTGVAATMMVTKYRWPTSAAMTPIPHGCLEWLKL
jgi:hippurate hydrolase